MRLAALLLALSLSGCTLGQARWAYVSGAAADLGTTQAALDRGLTEANPLMAATGEPVLVSGLVTAGTVAFAEYAARHGDETKALWFYRIFSVYRWTLAAINLHTILEDEDEPNQLEINRKRKVAAVAVRVSF